MTEIPEHLLKRSRERRAALGLGGDEGTAAGPSEPAAATSESAASAPPPAAPAPAASAPTGPAARRPGPAPAAPSPPKPDPPYVAAAKSRRKIPFWAMGALSLLPVWGFMYVRALTEAPEVVEGPLGVGVEVYGTCSSCHGAAGEGSAAGRQFNEGEVLLTFPHIEDQLRFVYYGTAGYQSAGVDVYGNPDREGGAHSTGSLGVMPAQGGQLTEAEILGVVCHERYTIGGADPGAEEYAEEYENWCSDESPVFAALEGGATLPALEDAGLDFEFIPIGDAPAPGNPPGEVAAGAE